MEQWRVRRRRWQHGTTPSESESGSDNDSCSTPSLCTRTPGLWDSNLDSEDSCLDLRKLEDSFIEGSIKHGQPPSHPENTTVPDEVSSSSSASSIHISFVKTVHESDEDDDSVPVCHIDAEEMFPSLTQSNSDEESSSSSS